jgi:copper chaperone
MTMYIETTEIIKRTPLRELSHEPDVLIFKTNIRYKKDLKHIDTALGNHQNIFRWNVDREDPDKVLRIESIDLTIKQIITIINKSGYACEELTY